MEDSEYNLEAPKYLPEEPPLLLFLLDLVEVAIRVDVVDRIVDDIAVTVMVLWIIGLANERVWGDESAKLWIIVPATIVVEAAFWIKLLAGEAEWP